MLEGLHLLQQQARQLLDVRARLFEAAVQRVEVCEVLPTIRELLRKGMVNMLLHATGCSR